MKWLQRIEQAGTASVASGAELLAVILKTGSAGCDVMELSRRLIDAFGGVETLVKTDLNTLKSGIAAHNLRCPERKILGLGRVKILELTAAFGRFCKDRSRLASNGQLRMVARLNPHLHHLYLVKHTAIEARFTGLTETAILPTNHKKVLALA